ncbi:MAG: hypothetical protein J6C19_13775 [Lachnospiraceae bacterium]|nr:hypothetical protein [Lachnospiraceae bacterium]
MDFKEEMENRAKQFIPFDALKGFDAALHQKEQEHNQNNANELMEQHTGHMPVPVIASYSSHGKVVPLYFSVEGAKVKISRVKWQERMQEWGCKFRCEVMADHAVKEVDLYYYKNKNTWMVHY